MVNNMRRHLPSEWTDAAAYRKDSPEVTALFDKLNNNWQRFFRQFDMYSNLDGEDLDQDLEVKAYYVQRQLYKFRMVLLDIEKDLKSKGLYEEINTRKLEWHTEVGDEDFKDGEECEGEDARLLKDMERAVKALKFARRGVVIQVN
jgi:hypothetical protein